MHIYERRVGSTYPCRSRCGSVARTRLMESYSRRFKSRKIRSSAERTAPPRSTHVQPGDVSHALIQQGERERLGRLHPTAARRRGGGGGARDSSRASPSAARDEEGEG